MFAFPWATLFLSGGGFREPNSKRPSGGKDAGAPPQRRQVTFSLPPKKKLRRSCNNNNFISPVAAWRLSPSEDNQDFFQDCKTLVLLLLKMSSITYYTTKISLPSVFLALIMAVALMPAQVRCSLSDVKFPEDYDHNNLPPFTPPEKKVHVR